MVLIKDLQQPIVLVVPEGKSEEAITRLSRVGYDNTFGYLEGGIEAWKASGRETSSIESISATVFETRLHQNNLTILDVRKDGEYKSKHIEDVQHFALDFINENMHQIDTATEYHIHCAGGYRSVIAASILKARGFNKVINIEGGFD